MRTGLLVLATLTACAGSHRSTTLLYRGMCDASGAGVVSEHLFVVADDESNLLRIYDDDGGKPLADVDVSTFLGLAVDPATDAYPEADLEGVATVGDRHYWLSSHARESDGMERAERKLFFATRAEDDRVTPVGTPYARLLTDLLADPRLAGLDLDGPVEIEGLSASAEPGQLLIGFRAPVPAAGAIVVALENPAELVDTPGARARFGAPRLLDLGGAGIRALERWRGTYLIVAGNRNDGGSSLYTWDGQGAPRRVEHGFADLNPEGLFAPETGDRVLVLSDDGTRSMGDRPCKDLKGKKRRFRAVWVSISR